MNDPRLKQLADVLVNYSVSIKPGDKVIVTGTTPAEPLMREILAKILVAGGYPFIVPSLSEYGETLLNYGSDDQLQYVPEALQQAALQYQAWISIRAPLNTKALSRSDPLKQRLRAQGEKSLVETVLKRSATHELRWVLVAYPTHALAQDAEMSLNQYEDFVYNACLPDEHNPVGFWQCLSERQQRLIEWLKDKKQVNVRTRGTDLSFSIQGRSFENCDGRMNMPDGEIFTGPVEDSVEGHVSFSYPTIFDGREVSGVELWFSKGQVVKATAEKNEKFLLEMLDTDSGARRLGEFAIGTNDGIQQFTREILFDEKIGGSFHVALGAGLPETGSTNESAIHWDMICDMRNGGEIIVDGELFYQNGNFLIS
jgi:aminopeptidase